MAMEPQIGAEGAIVAVPATPPPQNNTQREIMRSPSQPARQRPTASPTPPMSSQAPRAQRTESVAANNVITTPTTTRKNAAKDLPSVDHIEHAGLEDLRRMVKNLVSDLTDSRIASANARLQHQFLLLETSQAAERAEVESQLSRRQVDHLRVKQNRPDTNTPRAGAVAVQPPAPPSDVLMKNVRDLEGHCEVLEDLCDQLKREKELQAERIQSLSEHNSLLVNRIRENREHFTRIREQSPMFSTPRQAWTTPRRRGYSRYQEDGPAHAPFAALIAADQILSQETASVPSTPTKSHARHFYRGHTRGAHSLGSANTPKNKERPSTSDGFLGSQLLLSAPASQLVNESAMRERHDRDSTISVSDDGRGRGDQEELMQSQASSLATDMLRKNPSTCEQLRQSQDAEKSSNLLQSKLFGTVKKPSHGSPSKKRQYAHHDGPVKSKKMRNEDRVGLGIEA